MQRVVPRWTSDDTYHWLISAPVWHLYWSHTLTLLVHREMAHKVYEGACLSVQASSLDIGTETFHSTIINQKHSWIGREKMATVYFIWTCLSLCFLTSHQTHWTIVSNKTAGAYNLNSTKHNLVTLQVYNAVTTNRDVSTNKPGNGRRPFVALSSPCAARLCRNSSNYTFSKQTNNSDTNCWICVKQLKHKGMLESSQKSLDSLRNHPIGRTLWRRAVWQSS